MARITYQMSPGDVFGNLTLVSSFRRKGPGPRFWICKCSCGGSKTARADALRRGATKSCGCWEQTWKTVHGECKGGAQTAEYKTYYSMLQRCYNPSHESYKHYGGRGVRVCKEWKESYNKFLAHIGRRPTKHHQIERNDNDGDYTPVNVRWATCAEQANNRRASRFICFEGLRLTISQWSRVVGINPQAISYRLSRGWSADRILTTPGKRPC